MAKANDNLPTQSQICVLKVDLQCCEACPKKVNKKLQKIQGVHGIHIDTEEGLVIVAGLLDPAIPIEVIEKIGKEAELLAYEKDPTKSKMKQDHFLKRTHIGNPKDKLENNDHDHDHGWDDARISYMMPNRANDHALQLYPNYGMIRGYPGPKPAFARPVYRSNHPVIYNRPPLPPPPPPPPPPRRYVRLTRPPLPYPFSIYEQQEQDIGNAPHHILSDENTSVCSIT